MSASLASAHSSAAVTHLATLAPASLSSDQKSLVYGVGGLAILALLAAGVFARQVLSAGTGTPKMQDIAKAVQEGANAFLGRQFRTLSVFAVIVFGLLFLLPADGGFNTKLGRSLFFLLGAVFSALVGFIGMTLATRANLRVAAAAQNEGTKPALKIAFRSGGVVGMFTIGLGLLGAAIVTVVYNNHAPEVLEGFGFGGALLAMFMRVGGGIFTKAADVGADLVGKVEQGIPEDDPRNAATIADNVGDNVGDCAGMAADLFESYAVTLVASLILGQQAFGGKGLVLPLLIPAVGVITAVIGILSVRSRAGDRNAIAAINRGFFLSAIIAAGLSAVVTFTFLPKHYGGFHIAEVAGVKGNPALFAWLAVVVGIVLAAAIQLLTGYFTETNRRPVKDIGEASQTGAATVILGGISVGLESAVYSALLIGGALYGAFLLGHGSTLLALFYVALAGTGLLTTVGVIVSMDTFGPISDNAQGIAEMSGDIDEAGAAVLTELDAVGNTTKAITKGIAIATAVLAATALFGSYGEAVLKEATTLGFDTHNNDLSLFTLSVNKPNVLFGLIIGASVVFLFSGLAINAVARAAARVVTEVRAQFRDNPGIMDYSVRPNYAAVVDICTKDSLRELATPGLLAVMAPISVGFFLGYEALGGFLAGAISTGVLMAVFLSNSGGAWDNAKKLIEDGNYGGKGSEAHAATVIGDTVGDPFKDTAGPALNPLIKVMNLVAVLIAPSVFRYGVVSPKANTGVRVVVGVVTLAVIVVSLYISKRRKVDYGAAPSAQEAVVAAPAVSSEPLTASVLIVDDAADVALVDNDEHADVQALTSIAQARPRGGRPAGPAKRTAAKATAAKATAAKASATKATAAKATAAKATAAKTTAAKAPAKRTTPAAKALPTKTAAKAVPAKKAATSSTPAKRGPRRSG
jgi:K(+)-stimulated pyrophosphate-energized sodium pump